MHGAFLPDDRLSSSRGRRRTGLLLILKKALGRSPRMQETLRVEEDCWQLLLLMFWVITEKQKSLDTLVRREEQTRRDQLTLPTSVREGLYLVHNPSYRARFSWRFQQKQQTTLHGFCFTKRKTDRLAKKTRVLHGIPFFIGTENCGSRESWFQIVRGYGWFYNFCG